MSPGLRLRLVLLSFLMLFVELALIRWTGANNVHLAYLTNFVLLASFLGIGLGFLRAERGPELFPWAPAALALLVGFVLAFPVDLNTLEGPSGLRGAFGMAALPLWLSLSVVFVLTTATMAGIGHGVARVFVRFSPLEAYRLDILGSISGIVFFWALTFWDLRPVSLWANVSAHVFQLLGSRITFFSL